MNNQMSRRDALSILAGLGVLTMTGGAGCFNAAPTRPSNIWSPAPDQTYALINASVIDVNTGVAQAGKAVLVNNGMILGVVDADEPGVAQMTKVDCRGACMIPGLINAHCHINSPSIINPTFGELGMSRDQMIKNYESAVSWGVTTVRDMGAMPKIIAKDRAAIDRGEILGPRILTSMSVISVPNGYPDFSGNVSWMAEKIAGNPTLRVKDASQARDAVKRVRDYGADWVKIAFDDRSFLYGRGTLDVITDAQLDAIKNEAEKNGLPVAAHHLYSDGLDRGLAFSVNTLEHVAMDREITDAQIQKILDTKTPLIPTISVGISMVFKSQGDPMNDDPVLNEILRWKWENQMTELPLHCTPDILVKTMEIERFYQNEEYKLKKNRNVISYNTKVVSKGLVTATKNIKRLIDAGANLGVGNDSGVPFNFPGMVHLEMEMLTRLGMEPAWALRSATLGNAEICKISDRCGSIDKGKWADLVLLEKSPLEDIKNVGKVLAVFKNGDLVSSGEDFNITMPSI